MIPQLGPAGRGGARRRTRCRMGRRQTASEQNIQSEATQSAPRASDYTDQLEKLEKLHQDGVLTDEEFASKKKETLDKNI
ncbi:MAG TPA: SHOCT domain-containing protein [Actinobacteria bacterium]|nr:SHOCT domain-containing protein [Actinomycetota bacterium]